MQKVIVIIIFLMFLESHSSMASNNAMDSLLQILEQTDTISDRGIWLSTRLKLANAQVDHAQFEEALIEFESLISIANEKEEEIMLKAKLGIGEIYYLQGYYDQALSVLQPICLSKNTKFIQNRAEAIRISAMNHVFLGNYAKAYQLQIEALQIFKETNNTIKVARLHYDVGNNYFYQEQYQVALEYFQKALSVYEIHHDTKGLFRCYAAMGSVYGYLGDMEKSISFNLKALNSAKKKNNKQDISWASLNVGANHYSIKSYDLALKHLLEGLKLSRETKDDLLASNILVTISRVYTDTKQFDKAIDYLEQALAIAEESHDRSNIREMYKWFAETYYEIGSLEKYHDYMNRFISIKDTLYNEEVMAQMNSMQQSFEVKNAEREKEIALLKKSEEIKDLKENNLIGAALLGLLVLTLISSLLHNRHKNQKALNQLLARKNEEILKQNQRLEASNRDLEQFAHIISHDLKEPLRNISGFTTLLKRRCHKYQDKEAAEYMGHLFNSVNQMHQLLTDLLDYSKISTGVKERKTISSKKVIYNALSNLQHQIQEDKAIIYAENFPFLEANPSQLLQVFQNLIANALKFKNESNPIITVSCTERDSDYLFSVQDNGIGIESVYFDKIFVPFQRLHNRAEYEGSGIGLSTCKKIIEEHGGKIWVESQIGKGTTFYFTLPQSENNSSILPKTSSQSLPVEL